MSKVLNNLIEHKAEFEQCYKEIKNLSKSPDFKELTGKQKDKVRVSLVSLEKLVDSVNVLEDISKKTIYILIGPPGSGKGFIGEIISKYLKVPTISIGQALREYGKKDKTVADLVSRGELVPLDITIKIVQDALNKAKNGCILDGFPRSLDQAKPLFDNPEYSYKIIRVTGDDSKIVERLSNRRICSCGETYNLITKPPKQAGVCDKCGKALTIRSDDNPETIQKRLNKFHDTTEKILETYKDKIVLEISGFLNKNEIQNKIRGLKNK